MSSCGQTLGIRKKGQHPGTHRSCTYRFHLFAIFQVPDTKINVSRSGWSNGRTWLMSTYTPLQVQPLNTSSPGPYQVIQVPCDHHFRVFFLVFPQAKDQMMSSWASRNFWGNFHFYLCALLSPKVWCSFYWNCWGRGTNGNWRFWRSHFPCSFLERILSWGGHFLNQGWGANGQRAGCTVQLYASLLMW